MHPSVLELVHISKTIKGRKIVKDINLTIGNAEVFGFLGPNGAGKTTTIRMIVGLIKPSEGHVRICGYDVSKEFVKAMSNVGCIIESPEMYKYLTGLDNLFQYAAMDKRSCSTNVTLPLLFLFWHVSNGVLELSERIPLRFAKEPGDFNNDFHSRGHTSYLIHCFTATN